METIIGRESEQATLKLILQSAEAELVAVYGRRRVGKTFLIRNGFEREMAFHFSGIHNASLTQQLENFNDALSNTSRKTNDMPESWMQAFKMLVKHLTPLIKNKRKVIFFDEFPWIHTPRSGFLQAFENFWNTWASRQKNLVVVICGSAAAWMIQKVINNRGGLHNRITRRIRLLPFTLGETETFLKYKKINLDRYQLLQLYMVMGGVPHYLKEVQKGESATQSIDRICFTKDGLLHDEFKNLFHSLFDNADYHMNVIRALARKSTGLSRNEIIKASKLTSGGGVTKLLEELTESGFITPYIPFDRSAKDSIFKLTDEYALFFLKSIENTKSKGTGSWTKFSSSASWKSWSGFAFESVCMKHVSSLKKSLGIGSVHSENSMWRYRQKENQGAQIDLLIDRQDLCINVCEIKFSINEYIITKPYLKELERKMKVFQSSTATRKTLFLTMITTYGVKNAESYPGLIQSSLTMDALFAQ